ncbi:3811_t:CDS:1, partial [Acaulospora colombiana]
EMNYERIKKPEIRDLQTVLNNKEIDTNGKIIVDLSVFKEAERLYQTELSVDEIIALKRVVDLIWKRASEEDKKRWEILSDKFTSE